MSVALVSAHHHALDRRTRCVRNFECGKGEAVCRFRGSAYRSIAQTTTTHVLCVERASTQVSPHALLRSFFRCFSRGAEPRSFVCMYLSYPSRYAASTHEGKCVTTVVQCVYLPIDNMRNIAGRPRAAGVPEHRARWYGCLGQPLFGRLVGRSVGRVGSVLALTGKLGVC